jgi:hypothetical protein
MLNCKQFIGKQDNIIIFTPKTDAKGMGNGLEWDNFGVIVLKEHKKPPLGEQRGRFFRIFAPDG